MRLRWLTGARLRTAAAVVKTHGHPVPLALNEDALALDAEPSANLSAESLAHPIILICCSGADEQTTSIAARNRASTT